MSFFIVFGSKKRPHGFTGGTYLDWVSGGIIGVYEADTPDDACTQAAKDSNDVGTFFAVEGTPFGTELIPDTARKLGGGDSPLARLEAAHAQTTALIERLANAQLPPGDDGE